MASLPPRLIRRAVGADQVVDNLIQAAFLFAVWKARCKSGRAANARDREPSGVTPLGYGWADDGCGKA